MKRASRQRLITHFIIFSIGIISGSRIPGLLSNYQLRKREKQALEQLEKYRNEGKSWLLISQYRWRRGDKEGSFEAAHKALELDPNYVLAIEKMAYNHIDIGHLEKGKGWLEKALKVAEIDAPGQIEMIKFTLSHIEKEMKP